MAPAAVFEMNSVMKVPTKQMAVMTTMGFVPQTSRMPKASRSAMPVFWMASPSTTEPANTMRMSQLMAFMAWLGVQQRKRSMAAAAMKAHCNSGITPKAESTTIAIIMMVETSVFGPTLSTSSPFTRPWVFCSSRMSLILPANTMWSPPMMNSFSSMGTATLSKWCHLISRPPFTSCRPA